MGDTQPTQRSAAGQGRRGAVWPWLAMPLVALAVFFALRSCHAEMSRDPAPSGSEQTSLGNIGGRQNGP